MNLKSLLIMCAFAVVAGGAYAIFSKSKNVPVKEEVTVIEQTPVAIQSEESLPTGKKEIKTLKLKLSRTLLLEGEVGFNAIELADQIAILNQQDDKEPINLIVTSPGGSVLAGAQLVSAIETSKAEVRVICRAICASMAAITLEYGHKRYATDRSVLMFHPASGGAQGDIDRMYSQIGMIKRYVNKMEADIANRMGISFQDYKALTGVELWIDSEDSQPNNYIDGIVKIEIENDRMGNVILFSAPENKVRNDTLKKIYENPSLKKDNFNVTW